MLTRFSRWISNLSNSWVVLIALLVFLIFSVIALPSQKAKVDSYSGSSGSPDLSLYYSADKLYQMAENFGLEGRRAYIRARFTFDLIFPVIYVVFLCTSISWINRRIHKADSSWQLTNLLPFGALLFDLLENGAAAYVISRFPRLSPLVAATAGIFTTIKWLFVGSSFILVAVGYILVLVRQFSRGNEENQ